MTGSGVSVAGVNAVPSVLGALLLQMFKVVSAEQYAKAYEPILVVVPNSVTTARLVQDSNALAPTVVIPLGRVMLTRPAQPINDPMLTTLSGKVMAVKPAQ